MSLAARQAFGGMLGLALAMGIGRFFFTPILPAMAEALSFSASQSGLIASANYLGYLVGALAASGRWPHGREKALLAGSVVASTVLVAAMGLTTSLPAFIAIRFLAGVASAFAFVFLTTIVLGRLAAEGRGELTYVHFAGVGLGISASAVVVWWLDAHGLDWRYGWYGAALVSVALGLGCALLLRTGGGGATAAPRGIAPAPISPALWKTILAYGLFGFGYIVTATFLIAIVRQGSGGPSTEASVWLVTGLSALPSIYLWSLLARRIGIDRAFALGCVVEAAGVAASVTLGGTSGPLIGGALLGFTFVAVTALGLQAARNLAGADTRRVLALMTAAFGTGQIIGPLVAGPLADWTGDFALASLVAGFILVLAALAQLMAGSEAPADLPKA